jgi:hypothetical protein
VTLGIIASSRRSRSKVTIIQSASGTTGAATADTVAATLSSAPTAGNSLLLFVCSDSTIPTAPSGLVLDKSAIQSCATYVYRKQTSAGTETSVVIDPSGSAARVTWVYLEVSGLADLPVGATATFKSSSLLSSASTGTPPATEDQVDGYAFAVHGWLVNSGTAPTTTQTGGFTELADVGTSMLSGVNVALAVAAQQITADAAFASTGTPSVSAKPAAIAITYRPYTPPVAPPPGTFTHGDQITTSNVGLPGSGQTTTSTLGATDYDSSYDNATITNIHFTGRVTVEANNITFRYCQFDEGLEGDENADAYFTIEDSDIGPATGLFHNTDGIIGWDQFAVRRCRVRNCNEGFRCQGSTLVEDTIVYSMDGLTDDHSDCFQINGAGGGVSGGTGLVFRRVNADVRWDGWDGLTYNSKTWGNATFEMGDGPEDMTITIEDSLLAGGYVSMHLEDALAATNLAYVVRNLKFVRGSFRDRVCDITGSEQGQITWSNVTYSDNGEAIPKPA